jgi:hypothetical protein
MFRLSYLHPNPHTKLLTASLSLQELLTLSQEIALRIVMDTTCTTNTNRNRFFEVDHL